jgi:hypothetical protein
VVRAREPVNVMRGPARLGSAPLGSGRLGPARLDSPRVG